MNDQKWNVALTSGMMSKFVLKTYCPSVGVVRAAPDLYNENTTPAFTVKLFWKYLNHAHTGTMLKSLIKKNSRPALIFSPTRMSPSNAITEFVRL